MEIITSSCYGNMKRYWRIRRYRQRLKKDTIKKKKLKIVGLGGPSSRRLCRPVKTKLRYYLKMASPIRLLVRLHNAYVEAMIRLAMGMSNHQVVFKSKKVARNHQQISVVAGGEEVDCRLALEVCKRLVTSRQLIKL